MASEEHSVGMEPLLSKEYTGEPDIIDMAEPLPRRQQRLHRLTRQQQHIKVGLILAYIPAIVLYVWMGIQWYGASHAQTEQHCIRPEMLPSPVHRDNVIEWNVKHFPTDFHISVFAGDPSPELDLAWHGLFEDNNVRVEKADLDSLGLQSIQLSDGGYVAQLGVFHELHCLKKIRHWIFKEHYVLNNGYSAEELEEWPAHVNHCIEMLRTKMICRGDTSLSTFGWFGPQEHRQPTAWDRAPHQCVDWEKLRAWTRANAVNISAPGALIAEDGTVYQSH